MFPDVLHAVSQRIHHIVLQLSVGHYRQKTFKRECISHCRAGCFVFFKSLHAFQFASVCYGENLTLGKWTYQST